MLIDIHCHLLPGVDDGARDGAECGKMLKMAYNEGIRMILATPHYYSGMDREKLESRKRIFDIVRLAAQKIDPAFKLFLGAELFYDSEVLKELKAGMAPTLNGSKYVLVEFPVYIDFTYMRRAVQNLQSEGYMPVFAHVERYQALRSLEKVEELVNCGVIIQVNADSISGKNGWETKRYTLKLLKEHLIHVVGTDAHGSEHRRMKMQECVKYIDKKVGSGFREQICTQNPLRIIRGENISEYNSD